MIEYISDFFGGFEMRADRTEGHSYKGIMSGAVKAFLEKESIESAFAVYVTFFDCYRIKLYESDASFIDLLDKLLSYEKHASVLIDKQRDHYIHSVNVFLLGLAVFSQNGKYRAGFERAVFSKEYQGKFDCPHEEFLFRWGIAALFHDIGYPVEISYKQLKQFVDFVAGIDGDSQPRPFIGYQDFGELDSIEAVLYKVAYMAGVPDADNKAANVDFYTPTDLLAYGVTASLAVDSQSALDALRAYLRTMQQSGFVDHGYYSAVILLKWYGFLVQKSGKPTGILFNPVLDAAVAILLHNCYKNMFMKAPFSLGALAADKHPIAYLLILCDELQEWNRTAYGVKDQDRVLPHSTRINISEDGLNVHYETRNGIIPDEFAAKKRDMLAGVLDLEAIFKNSLTVSCTTTVDLHIDNIHESEVGLLPRPLLENLEQMAKTIHTNYNKVQLERNPGKPLAYPDWDSLPDTLKFSNVHQAKDVFEKLRAVNFICLAQAEAGYEEVSGFDSDQIEYLARLEHDRWNRERESDGWQYGSEKDVDKKLTPYLVPYDELPEEIKEHDRDAVRNVFPLVHSIGMKVYQKK